MGSIFYVIPKQEDIFFQLLFKVRDKDVEQQVHQGKTPQGGERIGRPPKRPKRRVIIHSYFGIGNVYDPSNQDGAMSSNLAKNINEEGIHNTSLKGGIELNESNEDGNIVEDVPRDTLVSQNEIIDLDENVGTVDDVGSKKRKGK